MELAGGALDLGAGDWRDVEPEVAGFFGEKSERVAGFFWKDIREESFKRESNRGNKRYKIRKYIFLNILH